MQSLHNAVFGSIRMDHVKSESFYKGGILQRTYRKMTILWSFSYNFFVKFHGKKIVHVIMGCVINRTALYGPQREKTCLQRSPNNKGADQPAQSRSLISTFVIRFFGKYHILACHK